MFWVNQSAIFVLVALFAGGLACAGALAFVAARRRRRRFTSGSRQLAEREALNEIMWGQPATYLSFAQVAHGEFKRARSSLLGGGHRRSVASEDYTLCCQVLMAAFEREPDRALGHAMRLVQLPIEEAAFDGQRQRARRLAVVAVAKIMAGIVDDEDWEHLGRAPTHEPALLWPCRYAAAALFEARGRCEVVERLLCDAPLWPASSHFHDLHAQLLPGHESREASAQAA